MFYKIFRHIIFRKFFVYLNMSNSGFFSYGRERCKRRRFVVLVNPCIVSKISDMDTEYVRDLYISGYRSSYTVFELKQTPSETTWDPFNFIALSNISQNYFATNKLVFMQYFLFLFSKDDLRSKKDELRLNFVQWELSLKSLFLYARSL